MLYIRPLLFLPLGYSRPHHHHEGRNWWPSATKHGRSPHRLHLRSPTKTSQRHHHPPNLNKKRQFPIPAKNGRRRQAPRTTRQTMSPFDSQRSVPRSLPQSQAHDPPHIKQHHHVSKKGSRRRKQHHRPRKPKCSRAKKDDSTASPRQNRKGHNKSKPWW